MVGHPEQQRGLGHARLPGKQAHASIRGGRLGGSAACHGSLGSTKPTRLSAVPLRQNLNVAPCVSAGAHSLQLHLNKIDTLAPRPPIDLVAARQPRILGPARPGTGAATVASAAAAIAPLAAAHGSGNDGGDGGVEGLAAQLQQLAAVSLPPGEVPVGAAVPAVPPSAAPQPTIITTATTTTTATSSSSGDAPPPGAT